MKTGKNHLSLAKDYSQFPHHLTPSPHKGLRNIVDMKNRKVAFTLPEGATHVALPKGYRRTAFTLAEVLITIGIIGVVAALTIPSLITKIQNKGYVEALKKNYSVLQQATNEIIMEEGTPDTWPSYGLTTKGNEHIIDAYKKHLRVNAACKYFGAGKDGCPEILELWQYAYNKHVIKYKDLSGNAATGIVECVFCRSLPMRLDDGTYIGITFRRTSNQTLWGRPPYTFQIDVNGAKGPNKIGRDVFFLYLKDDKTGKILPYMNERFTDGAADYRDTCDKDKTGVSCAYRVITEGKMNY